MHVGKEYERDNSLRVFCQAAAYPRWLPMLYWFSAPNWHTPLGVVPLLVSMNSDPVSYVLPQDHLSFSVTWPMSDGVGVVFKMLWKLNAAHTSTELTFEVRRAGVLQATYVQFPGTQEMRNGFCGPAAPRAGATHYPIGPFGAALAIEYRAVAWDGSPV